MNSPKHKQAKLARRHAKVRSQISGTMEIPRLNVFRSNTSIFLQLIDDTSGKTLISAAAKELKNDKLTKTEAALELGKILAVKAKAKGISKVVFDRGGYKYHGRVAAVATGAREAGLIF